MGERGVRDVLGNHSVNRVRRLARRAGVRGRLTGVWSETRRRGAVLEVRVSGRPVAEFHDRNGDGYVEAVFLRRFLRH